jgi:hypothetical protein
MIVADKQSDGEFSLEELRELEKLSTSKSEVRAICDELQQAYPKASRDRLRQLFYERFFSDEDFAMSVTRWARSVARGH